MEYSGFLPWISTNILSFPLLSSITFQNVTKLDCIHVNNILLRQISRWLASWSLGKSVWSHGVEPISFLFQLVLYKLENPKADIKLPQ
jgi:hypothetical protein